MAECHCKLMFFQLTPRQRVCHWNKWMLCSAKVCLMTPDRFAQSSFRYQRRWKSAGRKKSRKERHLSHDTRVLAADPADPSRCLQGQIGSGGSLGRIDVHTSLLAGTSRNCRGWTTNTPKAVMILVVAHCMLMVRVETMHEFHRGRPFDVRPSSLHASQLLPTTQFCIIV